LFDAWNIRAIRVIRGCLARYAAGKLTTVFLPVMASAAFAAGKKVSSTYFLAHRESRLVFTILCGFDSEKVRELIHSRG
jgi:hypothetical protein